MAMNEELKALHSQLDALLNNTDLTDVSAESTGFQELPDGYYNCEVEKAELKISKSSGQPMAAFQFKVSEDGYNVEIDEKSTVHLTELKKTKNRKIFINYVLKNDTWVRRFVTDMLKFEGDTAGESLLPKEAFLSSETIEDALDILVGKRIYIQVSTTVNEDDSKSTWNNLISWKRAAALELPM